MLSAAPIREVCGTAYAEDACTDLLQETAYTAVESTKMSGTILSRLLKILVDTAHIEEPAMDFDLEEALGG